MSKRTHDKELARARAKRQADRAGQQHTRRMVVAGIVGLVAIAAVVLGFVLSGDEDPTSPAPGATATPTAAATPTAGETVVPGEATTAPGEGAAATDPATTQVDAEPCPPPEDAPEVDATVHDEPPEMQIDPEASYTATMETSCGTIEIELFAEDAPTTVNNFVFLAEEDYYVGVPFHRVIEGFMIQGGDPAGTGCGQDDCANFDPEAPTYPGYTFEDELDTVEEHGVGRGMLAMANSGPDTNGSQFFIIQGDASHLETHTVFGEVVEGMDVVDRIATSPVDGENRPEDPIVIIDVAIEQA